MKKISLFSLFGLAGMLAFFTMPIYAQEDVNLDDGNIISEAEDIDAEDLAVQEFNSDVMDDGVALEMEDIDNEVEGGADVEDDVILDPMENIDASIGDIIGIPVDEDVEDDPTNPFMMRIKIGNEIIDIDSFSFFLSGIGLAILVVVLIWLVLCHIALWRIFGRAGESKWKSLIPLYNLYIVFKISGIKNWFWYMILIIFISALASALYPLYQEDFIEFSEGFTSVVIVILGFLLSKKFGRGNDSAILYTLFSGIAILILGFGDYKYQGESEKN